MSAPRIALVHDHLVQDGGAERVVRSLMRMFPEAPVYTLLYDAEAMGQDFAGKDIRTSVFQRIPFARRHYKWLLLFIDGAFRRFDLSDFDIVISSSSGWAKSVQTSPETLHVCYCHTPIRYIWSSADEYIGATGYPKPLKWLFRKLLGFLRRKDLRAARGVDHFIANSRYVADRIKQYYDRESIVINPPVATQQFTPRQEKQDYYLVATRLEPYKRVDLVIEAANKKNFPLRVMGAGTQLETLRAAAGKTVEFTGRVSDEDRRELFASAKAFINPQDEDFGITLLEALASGTPVIAFAAGGALETIRDGVDGILFAPQTVAALTEAIARIEGMHFDAAALRARADEFSEKVFTSRIHDYLQHVREE